MQLKKKLEKEIVALDQAIQAAHNKVNVLIHIIRNSQNAYLEQNLNDTRTFENNESKNADDFYSGIIATSEEEIISAIRDTGIEAHAWSSRAWGNLWLPTKKTPPEFIRIGELQFKDFSSNLPSVPAILPLVKTNHVMAFYPRQLASIGAKFLSSIAWRIVTSSSPENYKFTFIDSVDHGSSFSSLLELPEVLRGNKIFCQSREIEDVLQKAVNDMEDVKQRRLKEKYNSLEEYNLANRHTALPYRFIVFNALPEGFTDQSVAHLVSLAHSGIQAGIYLIGGIFSKETQIIDPLLNRLIDKAACISIEGDHTASWDDPLFAHLPVRIDVHPSKNLTELISSLAKEAVINEFNIIEFAQYAPEITDLMNSSGLSGLSATVGIDQDGDAFNIDLGPKSDTFNAIVGGRIHSGKTNFLHNLILSLCLKYSDEEIQLYLADFKEGVEFQDYALYQLPHAKAIVIEAEREFGLSILEFLDEEMERRSELFKEQESMQLITSSIEKIQKDPYLV